MTNLKATIIGGGLAGSEAALQLAYAGVYVTLHEMRPVVTTPAHVTGDFAELVCSNSFKGLALTSAHGLFKEELKRMGSKLLDAAFEARVPAGESLTVDRKKFSDIIRTHIESHSNIQCIRSEIQSLPDDTYTLIATGPLTSPALSQTLSERLGKKQLAFFDAISPVIDADSINWQYAFRKNRWEKGDTEDFINCPLDKETYIRFVQELCQADAIEEKPFEKKELFEGCLPIEELARRGEDTLRFGPFRPVGLRHPETGESAHAVLQLRAENKTGALYNLVGCQTRLKWATQKRIFKLIPALRDAEFVRLGAMHRNTFINSSELLNDRLNLPGSKLYFAGQVTGAEGYTEAVGTGLYAASTMYADMTDQPEFHWPENCCLGSLVRHITTPNPDFQPMNLNFGLLPRPHKLRKSEKKTFLVKQCIDALDGFRLPWDAR